MQDDIGKPAAKKQGDVRVLPPPPRPPAGGAVWARRIVVWGTTIGLCIFAAVKCSQVLFPHHAAPVMLAAPPARSATDAMATAPETTFTQAQELFVAGTTLLRTGDMSGMETLEQVVKSFPDSPQARKAILAMAATDRYMKNQPEAALDLYIDFLRRYPDDLQVPNAVGRMRELFAETQRADVSERLIRDALSKVEKDPQATARLNKLLEAPPVPTGAGTKPGQPADMSPAPAGAAVPAAGQPPMGQPPMVQPPMVQPPMGQPPVAPAAPTPNAQ